MQNGCMFAKLFPHCTLNKSVLYMQAKRSPLGILTETNQFHTGYLTLEFNEFCIINLFFFFVCGWNAKKVFENTNVIHAEYFRVALHFVYTIKWFIYGKKISLFSLSLFFFLFLFQYYQKSSTQKSIRTSFIKNMSVSIRSLNSSIVISEAIPTIRQIICPSLRSVSLQLLTPKYYFRIIVFFFFLLLFLNQIQFHCIDTPLPGRNTIYNIQST